MSARTRRPTPSWVLAVAVLLLLTGCTSGDGVTTTQVSHPRTSASPMAGPSGSTEARPEVRSSGPDLYRVDPASGDTETILAAARGLLEPERSPDGSRLAYEGVTVGGTHQIFVSGRGTKRQLTELPGGAFEPTWSPDGTQIAFVGGRPRGRATDIVVMDADGSDPHRLVTGPIGGGNGFSPHNPDWSPDGSMIVFDDFPLIRVVSIAGGDVTALAVTQDIGLRNGPSIDPVWSPDGRWIAFTRLSPGTMNGQVPYANLWIMPADGSSARVVSERRLWERWYLDPSWSPDGRSIVTSILGEPDGELAVIDVRSGRISYLDLAHPLKGLSWSREGILGSGGHYDELLLRPSW